MDYIYIAGLSTYYFGLSPEEILFIQTTKAKCKGGKCKYLDIFHNEDSTWGGLCRIPDCNCRYELKRHD